MQLSVLCNRTERPAKSASRIGHNPLARSCVRPALDDFDATVRRHFALSALGSGLPPIRVRNLSVRLQRAHRLTGYWTNSEAHDRRIVANAPGSWVDLSVEPGLENQWPRSAAGAAGWGVIRKNYDDPGDWRRKRLPLFVPVCHVGDVSTCSCTY